MAEYNSAYTGAEIDAAVGTVKEKETEWDNKQDAIKGAAGQMVGFDENGKPQAQDMPSAGPALDIYSTEETVVGTWIDGKPIYRKVWSGLSVTIPTNSWAEAADISDLSVDAAIKYGGIFYNPNSPGGPNRAVPDGQVVMGLNSAKDSLRVIALDSNLGTLNTAWLEYTKTTDEATVAVATVSELNDAYDEGVQSA